MISVQSNDQFSRALTELVIFAHSKINSHITDVKPYIIYPYIRISDLDKSHQHRNLQNLKMLEQSFEIGPDLQKHIYPIVS